MAVPIEQMRAWLVELGCGVEKAPTEPEELRVWTRLKAQVAEIRAKGGTVEIPPELP